MSSSGGMESFCDVELPSESPRLVHTARQADIGRPSYSDIATRLLDDRFLLTALELHAELIEAGRELPALRDFFSNPGNFEFHDMTDISPTIPRSSSQITLDSLDFTRLSEDGERASEDRVAVLEFELRKANEKINALRANLTSAADCETSIGGDGFNPVLSDPIKPHEQRALNFLINEYLLMLGYKLTSITFSDQNGDQDFEDWDDVGLNISKPTSLLQLYRLGIRAVSSAESINSSTQTDAPLIDPEIYNKLTNENCDLKKKLLRSQEEKMELVIDYETGLKSDYNIVKVDSECQTDSKISNIATAVQTDNISLLTREIVSDMEKTCNLLRTVSLNDGFEKELCKEIGMIVDWTGPSEITSEMLIDSLPASLVNICNSLPTTNKEIWRDIVHLLVSLILLNPEPKERDLLMQTLLNIKKRPQEDDRNLILIGLVRIAKCQGSEELIEAHLMPQCWDLMNNKYFEKRLLVVQICSQIALYIPSELRSSLLVSMLQQLLEDREEVVRFASVRSLSLVSAFIEDSNKYQQIEEVMVKVAEDPSDRVLDASWQFLLPVIARWSLMSSDSEMFAKHLLPSLLQLTAKQLEASGGVLCTGVKALMTVLPHLVMYVAADPVILAISSPNLPPPVSRAGFSSLCTGLCSPVLFYQPTDDETVASVMKAFDCYTKTKPSPYPPARLDFLLNSLLPKLLDLIDQIDPIQEDCVLSFVKYIKNLCTGFGVPIAIEIKGKMLERLNKVEKEFLDNSLKSLSHIPIFILSSLTSSQLSSKEELTEQLERFLTNDILAKSASAATLVRPNPALAALLTSFVHSLKSSSDYIETIMVALWKGVVSKSSFIKACSGRIASALAPACPETVLTTRIVPALITLASDSEMPVRAAALSAMAVILNHTGDKEATDKIYLQIESVLKDPSLTEDQSSVLEVTSVMGGIATHCQAAFREEVVLPGFGRLVDAAGRRSAEEKAELCSTLVDAYSDTIYCHISPAAIVHVLLPHLRTLVSMCNEVLPSHVDTVIQMERELESRNVPSTQMSKSNSNLSLSSLSPSNVEEMKQKVSKMFSSPITKPTNLPSIQKIFKNKK